MQASPSVVVLALLVCGAYAEVSEDCLWGREDAATCCKDIPNGGYPKLADPKDCRMLYVCYNNEPTRWLCFPPGLTWNVEAQRCEESDNQDQCPQKPSKSIMPREVSEDCLWGREDAATCCKDIPNGGYPKLADPKDCRMLYVCYNNEPTRWLCFPPGLTWNVEAQRCEESDNQDQCPQKPSKSIMPREVSEDCLWGREDPALMIHTNVNK